MAPPNPHSNQNFAAFGNTPGAGLFNQSNNMNNSNTNDPESSRMEDVGGADGLEGVNLQERQTANFASMQPGPDSKSSGSGNFFSSGGLTNSLQQKASEMRRAAARNGGYQ